MDMYDDGMYTFEVLDAVREVLAPLGVHDFTLSVRLACDDSPTRACTWQWYHAP